MASPYAERNYSEDTAREIDCAIREIVDHAYDRAITILKRNEPLLRTAAQDLLEKETLDEAGIAKIKEKLTPTASEAPARLHTRTG
jgi:cell division protease FtsH